MAEVAAVSQGSEEEMAASDVAVEAQPENLQEPDQTSLASDTEQVESYSYTRVDGTVEHAKNIHEARAKCKNVLGKMSLESASLLLSLAKSGEATSTKEADTKSTDVSEKVRVVSPSKPEKPKRPAESKLHEGLQQIREGSDLPAIPIIVKVESTIPEVDPSAAREIEVRVSAQQPTRQRAEEAFARHFIDNESAPAIESNTDTAEVLSDEPVVPVVAAIKIKPNHLRSVHNVEMFEDAANPIKEPSAKSFELPVLTVVDGESNIVDVADKVDSEVINADFIADVKYGAAIVVETPDEETFEAVQSENTGEAMQPVTIEALLAEPEQVSAGAASEFGQTAFKLETDSIADSIFFTEQIADLVEQTVELERQPQVEAMLERVYDLVDSEVSAAIESSVAVMTSQPETSELADLKNVEITPELQAIVTMVLHELGLAEPAMQQIEQFITRIRADKLELAMAKHVPATARADQAEQPQGFTASVWRRYQQFMHLHQPLARVALIQPEAA